MNIILKKFGFQFRNSRPYSQHYICNWQDGDIHCSWFSSITVKTLCMTSAMGRDLLVADVIKTIEIAVSNSIFNSLMLHTMNRDYFCRISFLNKMQTDSSHLN